MVFAVKIHDGKIKMLDPRWKAWLSTAKDGPYQMTVKKPRRRMTDRQRRYYWKAVCTDAGLQVGYIDPEKMHVALKMKFLYVPEESGKLATLRSITELSTAEFNEYVEKCSIMLINEYGCNILTPEEFYAGEGT